MIELTLACLVACQSSAQTTSRTRLSIFAASSLTEAFEALEIKFEERHPEIDARMTFAGSQVLRLQLEQGAAADVFASANEDHMRALVDAGLVSESRTFAYNELAVIVPTDNPAEVRSFADLPRATRLVLGTSNVPVGIYARRALQKARTEFGDGFVTQVLSHVVSEESNVRLVRAKVELGEANAAIVYRTDAASSKRVRAVPIPSAINVRASYPIAIVTHSLREPAARRFVEFVLSEFGQKILLEHGLSRRVP